MRTIIQITLIGIGATLVMDIWSYILSRINIKTLDYKLVGRWIGHFFNNKFYHTNITQSSPIKYESIIGWFAHYLIGITFSFILVICFGRDWLYKPTLLPALLIGIITIIAPFFIMQPAFGFGVAASKLGMPNKARLMSLISHTIYGIGLYISAIIIQLVCNLN